MRHVLTCCLGVAMVGLAAVPAATQSRRDAGAEWEEYNVEYDGRFTFVRIRFQPRSSFDGRWGRRDLKWDHDYPRAERHLARILAEITAIDPNASGSNILTLDDPEIFKYPVAYLAEPGFWTLSEEEREGLRAYLLKGGFLIVDDFVDTQWYNFEGRMRDVLPDARLIRLDATHPVFHSFFEIDALDHRHPYWPAFESAFYGVFEDNDPQKRLMVIVNYNNDIGESWEWSDTGFLPIDITNEAYKLGVNYIVYAMTH
ncbi:MAG: DUF4159 domain-containing protein [Gemmatimonadetes bacterium]|uniref:DUF4159 domain-containing protein n=1 Tax=Candidatus Kutchimonas denitrificans TaxID=3056748 RepID=A0AAE4Z6A3_9BACT|nr:DUF4159 domain-containing protein [Gemmatimonadota bacterium]NIR74585.1 DUF4159 domain-containing protein [Candidatus Kutchimonas denitrificans]NIS02775.1 DUF4159 domain-containing protein [Gemmatimonadota bacterium]NIT68936.1 DUF4159 domain-containing protein [Gemmatimonadota bacterium]NIU52241.1 DUF4159 domain-containing protein [Gemmatimonadota bacterium]